MSIFKFAKPLVEKIPGAAAYYRYLRDSKVLNTEVVFRDKLGFFFNGNLSMEKGEFEPQETAIVESLLESFDMFINIGANTGYYVCKALSRGVPVVAFEPNQMNVNNTKYSAVTSDYSAKTGLLATASTIFSSLAPQTNTSTFWQLEADLLDSLFSGALTQTLDFSSSC